MENFEAVAGTKDTVLNNWITHIKQMCVCVLLLLECYCDTATQKSEDF